VRFFVQHKLHGFLLLGSVVLCVTGGEALYADMGHFGRGRSAGLVRAGLPGAAPQLLRPGRAVADARPQPGTGTNPFYAVGRGVPLLQVPMVVLATMAAMIASQALISGVFSLTRQAVQLGYWPRVTIVHTSGEAEGQIYIPEINYLLMVGCLALVLAFRTSSGLAAAYGIAVTGTMAITSILFYRVVAASAGTGRAWKTSQPGRLFLVIDLSFLRQRGQDRRRRLDPAGHRARVFTMMTTWKAGRAALERYVQSASLPIDLFLGDLEGRKPPRVKGTAVFMTGNPTAPRWCCCTTSSTTRSCTSRSCCCRSSPIACPRSPPKSASACASSARASSRSSPTTASCRPPTSRDPAPLPRVGPHTAEGDTSYFLGRETLLTTGKSGLAKWRKALFGFLSRNARPATAFFGIPPNRVVEMGAQIEL
jgi:KUP system potassium uptake protein